MVAAFYCTDILSSNGITGIFSVKQKSQHETSALKLFTVVNYVINSVDNTKLPKIQKDRLDLYKVPLQQQRTGAEPINLCYN